MKQIDLEEKSKEDLIELFGTYKQMLESAKRYHATLDNMKEGFQMLDFNWHYLYVNNTVVGQSKYSREELIGCKITDRYPGIEKTKMFKTLELCMNKRISKNIENEFTYPDGTKAWFELSIQPINEGLFILSMDITDRKNAEAERLTYLREIEELLFKISHEVRQPVCQILGVSKLLDKSLISPDEFSKIISSVRNSIDLLDIHTKSLTTFAHEMKVHASIAERSH